MPGSRTPSLSGLFDELKPFRRPSVENWHPDQTVDFDLKIRANGTWVHDGGVITRPALTRLFATVLAVRGGEFFLMTPSVRYRIQVDDTPFQVVDLSVAFESQTQCIWFRTDMDEVVSLDLDHPLDPKVNPTTGEPSPRILVREGLQARLKRPVYYRLAEMAEPEPGDGEKYGVHSRGRFFPLM